MSIERRRTAAYLDVPMGLQEVFVEEARQVMGMPRAEDAVALVGQQVVIRFNHASRRPLEGYLSEVRVTDRGVYLVLDGRTDVLHPLNSIQEIARRPDDHAM